MKRILLVASLALSSSLLPLAVQAQPINVAKPIRVIGIVVGAPKGSRFSLRANGRIYLVSVLSKASLANVKGGDEVRVWGIPTRRNLQRAKVRVLKTGASSTPEDYN